MVVVLESVMWIIRFFFGACVFSFLNVVIARLPRGEGVMAGRSHCDSCGRVLTPLELIPCISYLALGGKCKNCKAKIPTRDFLVEGIGGAAFVGCGLKYGCGSLEILSLRGAVIFIFIGILIVVALIDWDTQTIYDRFHIMIFLLGIASIWLFPEHGLKDRIVGALVISVPMFLLAFFIAGAFGGGDIKLMAAAGFFLGTAPIVCAMFFGLLTGGVYGAVMLKSDRLGRKDHFAFGPFLAVGLIIACFYGDAIASWYLGLLHL